MSIRSRYLLGALCCLTPLLSVGCVTKRTVTRDGAVVAEGYIVKRPFLDRLTGR